MIFAHGDVRVAQRESHQPPLSRWLNHDGSDLRPPTHSTSLNATPSPLSPLCFSPTLLPTAHSVHTIARKEKGGIEKRKRVAF